MQLSLKQNFFSQFFALILNSCFNFKYFEKEDHPQTFCIFEIMDSENVIIWMSQKSRFRGPFNK